MHKEYQKSIPKFCQFFFLSSSIRRGEKSYPRFEKY